MNIAPSKLKNIETTITIPNCAMTGIGINANAMNADNVVSAEKLSSLPVDLSEIV